MPVDSVDDCFRSTGVVFVSLSVRAEVNFVGNGFRSVVVMFVSRVVSLIATGASEVARSAEDVLIFIGVFAASERRRCSISSATRVAP